MAKKNNGKYDSGVNIMGSVPNYNVMLDYISDTYGNTEGSTGAFEFRTEKSLQRFVSAIESCILKFRNDTHKKLFFDAIADKTFSVQERLVILFWQLTYSNLLFSRITSEVFMKAVYSGRVTIMAEEITNFGKQVSHHHEEVRTCGWRYQEEYCSSSHHKQPLCLLYSLYPGRIK